MKKLLSSMVLSAMVLLAGTSLNQAATTREDRGSPSRSPAIDRTDGPALTLNAPGLFSALKNWLLGNQDERGFPGQKDRNGTPKEGPGTSVDGVGGCWGVGGCYGGWR